MPSDDHALAHELATAAGRALLDLRARFADGAPAGRAGPDIAEGRLDPDLADGVRLQPEGWPGDAKELRDAGDRISHEFLMTALADERPDDAVLSEESDGSHGNDLPRTKADRVWIVDPLDGTREFGETDRDDWAVHVALWTRTEDAPEGDLVAGAVALPAQGVTLSTLDPPRPLSGIPGEPAGHGLTDTEGIRMVVSRTRPPAFVQQLARHLDATLVPMGSAGAKIAAVLRGEVDAYVHAGGQYEWDSAAPVAVAWAAGAHASRIDASPLRYNREDPTLPDIVVCRSSLAPTLLAGIRAVADGVIGKDTSPTTATADPAR